METGRAARFEVVEDGGDWIVLSEGRELGRFADQAHALREVAARLRDVDASAPASLSMRYQGRGA
jgi:hypothetical protein